MEDDDPVKITYQEQLKIPEEKNWANEVAELRTTYEIVESDEDIAELSKEEWKTKVYDPVKALALVNLNEEKNNLSKSSAYPDAESLKTAKYIDHFTVKHACLLFRVRSRIVDIKEFHQYKYRDKQCRCCETSDETLIHVLNLCPTLKSDPCNEGDEFSDDPKVLEKVVLRAEEFMGIIDTESEEENEE